ncbi:MAG: ATPase [Clostridia bacterium]|nr:ATPase [Clostridia bacterium]
MKYYCGWDGGGSKTRVLITDESGIAIAQQDFGPINLNGAPEDAVRETIKDCLEFMAALPQGIDGYNGLVIGASGISNHAVKEFIEKAVREYGYRKSLHLVGDHEIALAGAISGVGAILIAGTGSVCLARNAEGEIFRCGGYGHLIDDEGSGYAIGRDILAAVTQAFDGRANETCLTGAVLNHLNVKEHSQLISWLYSPQTDKKQIAALAPLLIHPLSQGDTAAISIADKAATHLAGLVIATCKKADIHSGELALMGSILTHYDAIRQQVAEKIQSELPDITIIKPHNEPAYGAVDIGKRIFA